MVFQDTIKLAPHGIGASDITEIISWIIKDSGIKLGTCQLFLHNNQSSLLISDTADEATKKQTVDFLAQLAPSNDHISKDIDESMAAIPDTMRTAITQTSISFPISRGRPALGAWQGIYLWERMEKPRDRKLTITIMGE